MKRTVIILLSVAVVIAIGVFGSGFFKQPTPEENGKIKIAATIFPLYDIIRTIGSGRVDSVQILSPGVSPHTFEVTPKVASGLSGSKVIFKIGYGLDDWVDGAVQSIAPDARIVAVSQGISVRHFSDGSVDPHYWLDLNNAKLIAANIAKELSAVDPQGAQEYNSRLSEYESSLDEANSYIFRTLSSVKQKNIATFHDAWYYFARAYGLSVAAAFEPFPGKEPTPQYLADFISTLKHDGIKVVFTEPQFSSQSIEQIAQDMDVELVPLNPVDGGADASVDFIELMKDNALRMAQALDR